MQIANMLSEAQNRSSNVSFKAANLQRPPVRRDSRHAASLRRHSRKTDRFIRFAEGGSNDNGSQNKQEKLVQGAENI